MGREEDTERSSDTFYIASEEAISGIHYTQKVERCLVIYFTSHLKRLKVVTQRYIQRGPMVHIGG